MFYHLPDHDSQRTTINLSNPGFVGYLSLDDSPFSMTLEELQRVWGDVFSPTYPLDLESMALCGVPLIRVPRRHPEVLWDAMNYTLPCRIGTVPICQECLIRHRVNKH